MLFGLVTSGFGSSTLRFALSLYVLDITGRADIFSIVLAISFLPYIFSPIGGAIADRFNRRNLIVAFNFLNSFIVIIFIAFLSYANASVIFIAITLALLSFIDSMQQPTLQASVPTLVKTENLEQASGILFGVGALPGMLSPVLGGVLYGVAGINLLLIFCAALFFVSAIINLFVSIPYVKQEKTGSFIGETLSDLKSGFRYMMSEKAVILKTCIFAAALSLFLGAFLSVGTPYILRVTMQSDDTMYSVGIVLEECATIIGAFGVGLLSKRMKPQNLYKWILLVSTMLIPISLSVTSGFIKASHLMSFILFYIFIMLITMMATSISIYIVTQIQREVPNKFLGKTLAIMMAITQCASPLGQLMYGFLLEQFKNRVFIPVLICGAFTAIVALAFRKTFKTNSLIRKTCDENLVMEPAEDKA